MLEAARPGTAPSPPAEGQVRGSEDAVKNITSLIAFVAVLVPRLRPLETRTAELKDNAALPNYLAARETKL